MPEVSKKIEITPPAEVANHLNRFFPFDSATTQFATLVYGVLNTATGQFRYVSAGHPGPVHLPRDGVPVILESDGSPIGLAVDAYEEQFIQLAAEIDCTSIPMACPRQWTPTANHLAKPGSSRRLTKTGPNCSNDGVETLAESIARWRGSEKPQDDISILAVEFSDHVVFR